MSRGTVLTSAAIFAALTTAVVGPALALPRNAIYDCQPAEDAVESDPGISLSGFDCVQIAVCVPSHLQGVICWYAEDTARSSVVSAMRRLGIQGKARKWRPRRLKRE